MSTITDARASARGELHPDPLVIGAEPLPSRRAVLGRLAALAGSASAVGALAGAAGPVAASAALPASVATVSATAHPIVGILDRFADIQKVMDSPAGDWSEDELDDMNDERAACLEEAIADGEEFDLAAALAAIEAIERFGVEEGEDSPEEYLYVNWRHVMVVKIGAFLRSLASAEGGLVHG